MSWDAHPSRERLPDDLFALNVAERMAVIERYRQSDDPKKQVVLAQWERAFRENREFVLVRDAERQVNHGI